MSFDFTHSSAPEPTALAESFAENAIEADLKLLFADLYREHLADASFDANVLGATHLGSIELVRNAVNADGLVLMQGDREEVAMRYLHRAWKSANVQGRGVHFLRTYLNLLFPGLCEIDQLWHDKDVPYPMGLCSAKPRVNYWLWALGEPGRKVNGAWKVGGQRPESELGEASTRARDLSNAFLTSRIEIALDFAVQVRSISNLMHILRSVIPARLLPLFRFMLRFVLFVQVQSSARLLGQKNSRLRYPWCGRVVSDASDAAWKLGVDKQQTRLPSPFGSFKLGRLVGGRVDWRLNGCRTASSALMQSHSGTAIYRVVRVGEAWRRLNGAWVLSGQKAEAFGAAAMTKHLPVDAPQSLLTTQGEFIRLDYPFTAARLGSPCRLSDWRRLDGRWGIGGLLTPRPFGFAMRPDASVGSSAGVAMGMIASAAVSPESLKLPYAPALAARVRALDGAWSLGAETRFGHFVLNGVRLRARKLVQSHRLGGELGFALGRETPGAQYQHQINRILRLGSGWRLGAPKAPGFDFKAVPVH